MTVPGWVTLSTYIDERFSATGAVSTWWHTDFAGVNSRPAFWHNKGSAGFTPHTVGYPSYAERPMGTGRYKLTQLLDPLRYPNPAASNTLGGITPDGATITGDFKLESEFFCKSPLPGDRQGGIRIDILSPEGVSICCMNWFRATAIEANTVLQWEQFGFGPHHTSAIVAPGATSVPVHGFPYASGTIKAGLPVYIDDPIAQYFLAADAVVVAGACTLQLTSGLLHGCAADTLVSMHYGHVDTTVNPLIEFVGNTAMYVILYRTAGVITAQYSCGATEYFGSSLYYPGPVVIKGRTNDLDSEPLASDLLSFGSFLFQADDGFPESSIPAPALTSVVRSGDTAAATWEHVDNATSYTLYYAQGSTVDIATATSVTGIVGMTHTVLGLSTELRWSFAVAALIGTAEGPLSNVITLEPAAADAKEDYAAQAVDLLVQQYRQTVSVPKLLLPFAAMLQQLEDVLGDVKVLRYINNATDAQLDLVGQIVDLVRLESEGDDGYRARLLVKIRLNHSSGQPDDFIWAILLLLPDAVVYYSEGYPAHVLLQVQTELSPALLDATLVRHVKAGGVSLDIVVGSSDPFVFSRESDGAIFFPDGLGFASVASTTNSGKLQVVISH